MVLAGGLKLKSGYKLYASTQNAESFNIIAEGLDFHYPSTLPASCFSYRQYHTVTGFNTASVANPNLDGSGSGIVSIYQAGNGAGLMGSHITSVTIKALQSTNDNGMIRLFIYDGSDYHLFREVCIPQTTQSAFEPSFKVVLPMDLNIEAGYQLFATTQLAQSFAITVEGADWSYAIS